MVRFTDLITPPPANTAVAAAEGSPPAVPAGIQQFTGMIDGIMPAIEQMTGLSRREIFLQLLKTGFKGGGLMDIINGLAGKQTPTDAKFVRYVKTLAVWVPVFVLLMGGAIVGVVGLAKLVIFLMGGI